MRNLLLLLLLFVVLNVHRTFRLRSRELQRLSRLGLRAMRLGSRLSLGLKGLVQCAYR